MRYSKIHKLDVSNGEGVGVALFVQGCHFHCKNCFNSETWDFNGGKTWNPYILDEFLDLIDRPYITRISILGGEPLATENICDINYLLYNIRKRFDDSKKIWIYTGYTFEEIEYEPCSLDENMKIYERKNVLLFADILVDGQYVDELKDISLAFRGSSNQRIIDVKKSLKEKQVVLYIR